MAAAAGMSLALKKPNVRQKQKTPFSDFLMKQHFPSPEHVKLPKVAKGKRPSFFDDPSTDQIMTFFIELMTEFSVIRTRLDTVERLLDNKGTISRKDIEAYRPDQDVAKERNEWYAGYVKRVLRMHENA